MCHQLRKWGVAQSIDLLLLGSSRIVQASRLSTDESGTRGGSVHYLAISVVRVLGRMGGCHAMPMARASLRSRRPSGDASRARVGATPWLVFCGAMLLSGCAVGPDFERPDAPPVNGYTVSRLPASTDAPEGVAQRLH